MTTLGHICTAIVALQLLVIVLAVVKVAQDNRAGASWRHRYDTHRDDLGCWGKR